MVDRKFEFKGALEKKSDFDRFRAFGKILAQLGLEFSDFTVASKMGDKITVYIPKGPLTLEYKDKAGHVVQYMIYSISEKTVSYKMNLISDDWSAKLFFNHNWTSSTKHECWTALGTWKRG